MLKRYQAIPVQLSPAEAAERDRRRRNRPSSDFPESSELSDAELEQKLADHAKAEADAYGASTIERNRSGTSIARPNTTNTAQTAAIRAPSSPSSLRTPTGNLKDLRERDPRSDRGVLTKAYVSDKFVVYVTDGHEELAKQVAAHCTAFTKVAVPFMRLDRQPNFGSPIEIRLFKDRAQYLTL